jgi:lysophospholipase L1-like esterase
MNTRSRFRFLLVVAAVLCIAVSAHGATPKILLVGDSWAAGESDHESFEQALAAKGLTQWSAKGNITGIGGSAAVQWATPAYLQLITDELAANPSITIVHISMGGNDFLGFVNALRTREELDAKYQTIVADINTVVDHALSQRPDIQVGISSYDYLTVPLGYGMLPQAVNQELLIFGQAVREYADSKDRCVYLNNWGLMQHTFGIYGVFDPRELPAPGGPPNYEPFAGGDVAYVGVAMNDPIHLSAAGYLVLADNCLEQVYLDWLGIPALNILGVEATTPPTAPILEYRVTFSEAVTGVDLTDFRLETTGAITAAGFAGLHGSGDTYTVFVNRGFGSGTLTLSLVNDASITGVRSLHIPYGSAYVGETYSIAEDREVPVAAWHAAVLLAMAGAALAGRRRR